jgi:hypothetical protein
MDKFLMWLDRMFGVVANKDHSDGAVASYRLEPIVVDTPHWLVTPHGYLCFHGAGIRQWVVNMAFWARYNVLTTHD